MNSKKTLLLSIKPKYASSILSGSKRVELRRSIPILNNGDCVVIYASSPKKSVVGYFIVDFSSMKEPELLWKDVENLAGLAEVEFYDYFSDCKIGHAVFIKNAYAFPVEISYNNLPCKPTQNFRYLNQEDKESIFRQSFSLVSTIT